MLRHPRTQLGPARHGRLRAPSDRGRHPKCRTEEGGRRAEAPPPWRGGGVADLGGAPWRFGRRSRAGGHTNKVAKQQNNKNRNRQKEKEAAKIASGFACSLPGKVPCRSSRRSQTVTQGPLLDRAFLQDGQKAWHRQVYLIPPCALENGRASTIHAAVEQGADVFSSPRLRALAPSVRFIFFSEVPDSCSANRRKRAATAAFFAKDPSIFVSPMPGCMIHLLHRMLAAVTQEHTCLGDLHAMAFTTQNASRRNAMLSAAWQLVEEHLEWEEVDDPDPSWSRHTRAVLTEMFSRASDTAGQVNELGVRVVGCAKAAASVADRVGQACRFINWDTRKSRLVHFEKTCGQCQSRAEAVANVYAAIVESQVLLPTRCTIPGKHRFGSAMAAMTEQLPGLLISGLTERVLSKAFPTIDASGRLQDADGEDDGRQYIKNKVCRSKCAAADASRVAHLACASFALRPLEWLWSRIQHLDCQGGVLLDVVYGASPVAHVQKELCSLMTCASKTLDVVWWQYSLDARMLASVRDQVTFLLFSAAAQTWWRFEVPYTNWPFRLLRMLKGDPLPVAEEFYAAPLCCLEGHMSGKLRALWPAAAAMANDDEFLRALRLWGTCAKVSNMHTERLLARVKRATGAQGCPVLESYLANGYLAQFLAEHIAAGGDDPRVQTNTKLADRGVLLRKEVEQAKKASEARGGVRAWWLYAQTKLQDRPRFGYASYQKWKRDTALEFATMDKEAKRAFYDKAARQERLRRDSSPREVGAARRRRDASRLWGMASDELPVGRELFLDGVRGRARARLGHDGQDVDGVTFKQWGASCRQRFQEQCFVRDAGGLATVTITYSLCRCFFLCQEVFPFCSAGFVSRLFMHW